MADYICREEAIKELREVYEQEYPTASGDFDEYASHDVPNVLRNIPTADVQPIRRGRWEYYKNNGIFDTYKCTLCGEKYEIYMDIEPTTIYKYCPNCGAKMIKDGEQNG